MLRKDTNKRLKRFSFVGVGRVWNRDGRSSTYGCDLDPDNAEHVDQEPEVPGAHFVAGEFSGHSWLCGYYVHNVPRFAADPREAVYRGLARAASVLWHCDIFFRGYYFGKRCRVCTCFFAFM